MEIARAVFGSILCPLCGVIVDKRLRIVGDHCVQANARRLRSGALIASSQRVLCAATRRLESQEAGEFAGAMAGGRSGATESLLRHAADVVVRLL